MDLRVNHEEINNFYDLSKNESDLVQENINYWLDKIEELRQIWQGKDSDEFYENVTSYLNRMKIVPEFYNSVNEFVIDANRQYRNVDQESKKDFEKIKDYEGDEYV